MIFFTPWLTTGGVYTIAPPAGGALGLPDGALDPPAAVAAALGSPAGSHAADYRRCYVFL